MTGVLLIQGKAEKYGIAQAWEGKEGSGRISLMYINT